MYLINYEFIRVILAEIRKYVQSKTMSQNTHPGTQTKNTFFSKPLLFLDDRKYNIWWMMVDIYILVNTSCLMQ